MSVPFHVPCLSEACLWKVDVSVTPGRIVVCHGVESRKILCRAECSQRIRPTWITFGYFGYSLSQVINIFFITNVCLWHAVIHCDSMFYATFCISI